MDDQQSLKDAFEELVAIKYQLYNSLFLTLPFSHLTDVGVELPMFAELCRHELAKGSPPTKIVDTFFQGIVHTEDFETQIRILFLMLQFVERQVVLFDALEDAAVTRTYDFSAKGTLTDFLNHLVTEKTNSKAYDLLQNYRVRIVLTAHPTQFYPFQVLGIIQDLTEAVKSNNLNEIRNILLQLGKTSFKNQARPTPIDEAKILIHYLEKIFYPVIKKLQNKINTHFHSEEFSNKYLPSIFELGFWPGGDRDGNPNVTSNITLKIAEELKLKIIDLYIKDLRSLKRRLTFTNMWECLDAMINRLLATQISHQNSKPDAKPYQHYNEFIADLMALKEKIITEQHGLFVEKVQTVIIAAQIFGFHFATIDIRQNSSIHAEVIQTLCDPTIQYTQLTENDKVLFLNQQLQTNVSTVLEERLGENSVLGDVLNSLRVMRVIQKSSGEKGSNRYIISNTQSASDILEVFLFALWSGWPQDELSCDIVPLFETIPDLNQATLVMEQLYSLPIYKAHLKRRNDQQIVMLGFSDGTKDGGYITANWAIFRCKQNLFELSKKMGVQVIFFDGRGGPPARGGGDTHLFYRAMEDVIDQRQIQLTIQGQTVSSKFGTSESASYNIEQLFTSGLLGPVFHNQRRTMTADEFELLERFSAIGYDCYQKLKNHPLFGPYLETITPLNFFGDLNIASRPPRRKTKGALRFEDLRAIPFVGGWSQIKQNIPGFYGIGTALNKLIAEGEEIALKNLYQNSLFFRTLLSNAMQSLLKSNFNLTQYLSHDPKFGEFWQGLCQEAELSIKTLKIVSGQHELLDNNPVIKRSIQIREQLVLPLLVIQQYAMLKLQALNKDGKKTEKHYKAFYNLILKSIAANINASRNSA